MKKIIILIAMLCCVSIAKTINIMDWYPEYKYKSTETYTRDEAKEYCKGKEDCAMKYEGNTRRMRIYTHVNNCKPVLTGKMDTYIATPSRIRHFIDVCADENMYEAIKLDKYPEKYGYVWKIQKKINYRKVNFVENK